jgi:hypothetical protein
MTNNGRSRYFDEPLATQLEIKREGARKRHHV